MRGEWMPSALVVFFASTRRRSTVSSHVSASSPRASETSSRSAPAPRCRLPLGRFTFESNGRREDLQDPIERDLVEKEQFERLMGSLGISNDTTLVVYGDKNN